MNEDKDFDVVTDTLQKKIDVLWKMTQSNMNSEFFSIMDDIRLDQIDQLKRAINLWKANNEPF